MALFDRVRDTMGPANTITPERGEGLHRASPAGSRDGKAGDGSAAYAAEPEAIARSYYVEERGGERRYYDDYQRKALAIRADASAINSTREDLNTVRSMLKLAEARGWGEVNLSGSATFRREAWIEATAAGMTALGYKASDLDQQEADRRRAERGRDASEVRKAPAPAPDKPSPTVAEFRRTGMGAEAELSTDARLVLVALSEKIDRQMNKLNTDAKLELRAFAAVELARKERTEGPIVLSAEQRRAATAPEPAPTPRPTPVPRRGEMEPPRRSLGR
jgi:hypothetical protein